MCKSTVFLLLYLCHTYRMAYSIMTDLLTSIALFRCIYFFSYHNFRLVCLSYKLKYKINGHILFPYTEVLYFCAVKLSDILAVFYD